MLFRVASHLANLADMALQGNLRIRPHSILATGDRLTESMERKIRAAWNAPLYDLYCASESIHLGVKSAGEMRIMDDLNIVEVLDDRNAPVPAGGHGRVVLTNLYNYTLPVLRYELGDYVVRGSEGSETSFSTIRKIQGRSIDALPVLLDDGSVGSIHPIALADFYSPEAMGCSSFLLPLSGYESIMSHRRISPVRLVEEFQVILDRHEPGEPP
jgi:phenylacetate-coenzyme A ligase PaaK-like adenylate-forming protein